MSLIFGLLALAVLFHHWTGKRRKTYQPGVILVACPARVGAKSVTISLCLVNPTVKRQQLPPPFSALRFGAGSHCDLSAHVSLDGRLLTSDYTWPGQFTNFLPATSVIKGSDERFDAIGPGECKQIARHIVPISQPGLYEIYYTLALPSALGGGRGSSMRLKEPDRTVLRSTVWRLNHTGEEVDVPDTVPAEGDGDTFHK